MRCTACTGAPSRASSASLKPSTVSVANDARKLVAEIG